MSTGAAETAAAAGVVIIGYGGESEGPCVVTLDHIAHDMEQSHYSGFRGCEHYRVVCCQTDGRPDVLADLDLDRIGLSEDDDIATATWRATVAGVLLGTLTVRCDLRA